MLGFRTEVTSDPAQVPNHSGWGGVGIQNLDSTYTIDLCADPSFTPQEVYKLNPGNWYGTTGSLTFWARLTPGQTQPNPNPPPSTIPVTSVMAWINPGGAANVGGLNSATSAPLDVIVTNSTPIPVTDAPQGPITGVPNPPAGQDWQYTLPSQARLGAMQMVFNASNAVQSRYPYLYIWQSGVAFKIPVSISAIHRGNQWEFHGFLGWGPKPYTRTADRVQVFPLPDLIWPSGTIIQSFTGNLDAGDQWSGVNIVLSPY